MLQRVNVGQRALASYAAIQGKATVAAVAAAGRAVAGARVLHLSAFGVPGGRAAGLRWLVPLLRDAGLSVAWRLVRGGPGFAAAARAAQAAAEGGPPLGEAQQAELARACASAAAALAGELDRQDVIVVDDVALVGLRASAPGGRARWVWRTPVDLALLPPRLAPELLGQLAEHDVVVLPYASWAPSAALPPSVVQPLAVDPLAPRSIALAAADASFIAGDHGLDPERPILLQVGRIGPARDQLGTLECYRRVQREHGDAQLVLAGPLETGAEGAAYLDALLDAGADDPDVHLVTAGLGDVELNALEVLADVVVHGAARSTLGLPVVEAQWKGRPVVAADAAGMRELVEHARTGYLAGSPVAAARFCVQLLDDDEAAARLARDAKEEVRRARLAPLAALAELELVASLRDGDSALRGTGAERA